MWAQCQGARSIEVTGMGEVNQQKLFGKDEH
jgi:hypothetical protein